ncbi:beta-ketoacyl-ACP synthase [Agarilytica rhodophyticola]|uniref:beta-ketoacyl-ACP synthase n=1 Tax=Agarilytica rhodophyticola TaxID=1737490 RepID=UPI000B34756C|nr:beta-ketoacyl-ACP synthase [Agarilytica rhodophyticola]
MNKKRVVITGISAITPLGDSWREFKQNLQENNSSIRYMPEWENINELNTRLAAPIENFSLPKHYTRKKLRTMGRVSRLAVRATELALQEANLLDEEIIKDGSTGISYGSCTGSTDAMQDFSKLISQSDISDVNATTYIRMMSHTAPVNIAVYFGLQGRVIATSTACTSGSQGIGYAFEAIQSGKQNIMLAGGAEELCPSEAAIFDTLYATSLKNDTPSQTPRPFDRERDGLVVGEGACTFVLEELEHAQQRNANIIAEVVGFGTNCDGQHVTQPTTATMGKVIQLALEDAQLSPEQIAYVNAHGTATQLGDVAESQATHAIFGKDVAISSLKGHIGHTLGACGAIEAWASIHMMRDAWFAPTLNLENVSEECAELDYITEQGKHIDTDYVMSNNFAFGGINTSLIFKKWKQ